MNIPLPGPFSYSVGAPRIGKTVRTLARDSRDCKARRATAVRRTPQPGRQPGIVQPHVRYQAGTGKATGWILLLVVVLMVALLVCNGLVGILVAR
jgi:hypothetical protein